VLNICNLECLIAVFRKFIKNEQVTKREKPEKHCITTKALWFGLSIAEVA
jgi:hypothetical protein